MDRPRRRAIRLIIIGLASGKNPVLALHYAVGESPTAFLIVKGTTMSGYLGGKEMVAGTSNEAPAPIPPAPPVKAVTIPSLLALRAAGTRISMLTCYDASFAAL